MDCSPPRTSLPVSGANRGSTDEGEARRLQDTCTVSPNASAALEHASVGSESLRALQEMSETAFDNDGVSLGELDNAEEVLWPQLTSQHIPVTDEHVYLSGLRVSTQLRAKAISHDWDNTDSFWSAKLLSQIMTKEAIMRALKYECAGFQAPDQFGGRHIESVVEIIMGRILKIFALLLLMERGGDILAFIKEGVCDSDLPFDLQGLSKMKPGFFRQPTGARRQLEGPLTERVKCFDDCGWRFFEFEYFSRTQWRVLTPYFETPSDKVPHYVFHPRLILPWCRTEGQGRSGEHESMQGGFGTVRRVKIESSSHGFTQFLESISLSAEYFAVKSMTERLDFQLETNFMKSLGPIPHNHIIPLLATFEQNKVYNILLPYAEWNLYDFWRNHDGPLTALGKASGSKHDMFWMARQMTGLASALTVIHNVGSAYSPDRPFGRHGDIKPENILCFQSSKEQEKSYILFFADLGSGAIHKNRTKSRRSGNSQGGVMFTPAYRPPEWDIKDDGPRSRSFDIWSFGCLILEFCAWTLGGIHEVEKFEEIRRTRDVNGHLSSAFFMITRKEENNISNKDNGFVKVKDEVLKYISSLHSYPNCTHYIQDLLYLVGTRMLLTELRDSPTSQRRAKSDDILKELETSSRKADADMEYVLKACPCKFNMDLLRAIHKPIQVQYNPELTTDFGEDYQKTRGTRDVSAKFRRGRNRRTISLRLAEQKKGKEQPHEALWGHLRVGVSGALDYESSGLRNTDRTSLIRMEVDKALSDTPDPLKVHIRTTWQLLRCIHDEFDNDPDLGSVVTISGNHVSQSWVTTCLNFVKNTWGELGMELLEELQSACRNQIQGGDSRSLLPPGERFSCNLNTMENEFSKGATITFLGSREECRVCCEFLSWIAAVFRIPKEGKLQYSHAIFTALRVDPRQEGHHFHIDLGQLVEVHDQRSGACWTTLFPSMVMAEGFPVPEQAKTKGLQIEFGQMLEMADVLYDVNLEDKDGNFEGVYFDGVSYLLYPTAYILDEATGDATVQWHLKKKPRGTEPQRSQSLAPDGGSGHWLRGKTLDELSSARAVLGYCGDTVMQLGTESRLAQFDQFRYSLASPHDPPPEVSLTGLTASLNAKGFATIGASGTVKYPKRHRVSRKEEKKKEYTEVLEDAERQWVILFETAPGQERAWMVSQLSLILELFNFWAFKRKVTGIRYARPGPSGVAEAMEVLGDGAYASTIVVPPKIPSDSGLCIGDIVKRIFNRIDTRICESAGTSQGDGGKGKIRFGKVGMMGWDWLELAGAPSISDEKTIREFPDPSWKPLTNLHIPVFMGQNLGQLITPNTNEALCGRWNPIPGGSKHNYLVASVASIQNLAQYSGHDECWRFANDLSWELREDIFQHCTDQCRRDPTKCRKKPQLLVIKKKRNVLKKQPPAALAAAPQIQIQAHGAIVFGTSSTW